jgi:hypothetical protein
MWLFVLSLIVALQATPPVQPPLVLNGKVERIEYCGDDPDVDMTHVQIAFTVENRGTAPVMFYKGDKRVTFVAGAENADALRAKRYSVQLDVFDMVQTDKKTADASDFVTIQNGQPFSFTRMVAIPVLTQGSKLHGQPAGLETGRSVLQVHVENWPYSLHEAHVWRTRLEDKGLLWFQPLDSEPIPIDVPADRPHSNCDQN